MENLYQDLPPEKRIQILEDNAYKVEEGKYSKKLNEDELNLKREALTDNYIQLNDLEDQKKAFVDTIKLQQKPLIDENKELLQEVKTGVTIQDGILYLHDDQEAGMMHIYNELGEWIDSRRLRPDERQTNIFSINKKAK